MFHSGETTLKTKGITVRLYCGGNNWEKNTSPVSSPVIIMDENKKYIDEGSKVQYLLFMP